MIGTIVVTWIVLLIILMIVDDRIVWCEVPAEYESYNNSLKAIVEILSPLLAFSGSIFILIYDYYLIRYLLGIDL